MNDKSDEVNEELFQSLPSRYEIGLDTTIKDSSFIFIYGHLFYYKCHKINPNHGGSQKDSSDWIKVTSHQKA